MSEWQDCTLGEYAKVLGGYAFKSSDFCGTGDFPVIKIKNVASGTLDMTGCQYISRAVADTAARFRAGQGDILIAMTGSHVHQPSSMVGKVTRYSTYDIAYINQRVGKVFSKDIKKLNEDFLFYFLKWDETTYGLALSAGGSANQANISAGQIEGLQISLPGVEEQRIIAEVLASLDDKIGLLIRQNSTLEALSQTYFRQWFFEENDNDPISVSDIATLENNSVNPGRQPTEPFYHYSLPAYDNAQTPAVELGKSILSNKFAVLPNTILVSKLNPVTPRIWRVDGNVMPNSICSTEFQVLKPKDMRHYLFLYCLMKSNDVVSSFAMSATGTSGSHQRIRPEYILEVETPDPDKDKLALFNEICTPMMERVKKNQKQIQTLQKLRDTLLPKLISGEVRVKQ